VYVWLMDGSITVSYIEMTVNLVQFSYMLLRSVALLPLSFHSVSTCLV
jgi:hypothetical protein